MLSRILILLLISCGEPNYDLRSSQPQPEQ